MKQDFEIEKELELVEMTLRDVYKEDNRRPKWEGYRDALLWVLEKNLPSKSLNSDPQG